MKKNFLIITILTLAIAQFSFAQNSRTNNLDIENSSVTWTGKKVTGAHMGSIDLKSGNLLFGESHLTGGSFVIDMTTIVCEDIENANANAKFVAFNFR